MACEFGRMYDATVNTIHDDMMHDHTAMNIGIFLNHFLDCIDEDHLVLFVPDLMRLANADLTTPRQ